ncbi:LysR family transcriptional regulator [Neobacillus sp. NRS-1170]|uniref:LysR family transcriptional regulator n=1 Tax=Neobacillus sp. NRS-1170 TaxID=3233898 RepID=UPI003D2A8450
MRIEQLLYIVEIAKTGSITTASEHLHVSSPGISQAIKGLEEELGVKVFDRSRNGLQPTEAGKEIITLAQEILNKMGEIKEVAGVYSSTIEGNLSIAAINNLCRSIIPQTLAIFKTKFPGINIEIKEFSANDQVQKSVLNGEADLGLFIIPPSFRKENNPLIATHFLDSPVMVCFNKDSKLANKKMVTGKELTNYPIAAYIRDSISKEYYDSLSKYGKLNILFQSNSPETRKFFISQGLAIGLDCALATKFDPSILGGEVIALPLEEVDSNASKLSYYCIRLKNQHLSFAGKEFIKELHIQAKIIEDNMNIKI